MADDDKTPDPSPDRSSTIDDDLTGCSMGDLQVLRRLGRGGMADVYVANQLSLDRQVAVKILRKSLAGDSGYVERFRREARAAAKLTHPNIVQVYEVGQWEGLYYISQEFVDGHNLRECIDRDGPLSLERAIAVMVGVGAALDAASSEGITHRDIKPENIMWSLKGDVKVADFGLARISTPDFQADLTQVGLTLGTPLYMSPEQVQGKSVDVRSDLYSLGVTMFHVLTGRPPFEGDTPLAIAVQHLHKEAPKISQTRLDDHVPTWLDEVIARLMAKEPQKRFDSPASLVEYLQKKVAGTENAPKLGSIPIRLEATRELQKIMREEPRTRRTVLPWIAGLIVPVLAFVICANFAKRRPTSQITNVLNSETTAIEKQPDISRQFFEAVRVDTPVAWEAVWKNFPEESLENALYAAKARLQLARLYDEQKSPSDVEIAAKNVVNNLELPPHITAIGQAYLEKAARDLRRTEEASSFLERLQDQWPQLSPENQSLFREAVPREVLDRMKI